MKRSVATVVLALSVGLAACDDRSQAAPEVESPSVPAAEPAREAAPAAAPPAAATPAAPATAIKGAPAFAALYPGAQTDAAPVTASGPDGPGGIVTFTTDATPDAVIDFYRQRAEKAGLFPIMAMNQGEARAYGASARTEKGASLQVVAAPDEDGLTSVQLSWSDGA
ncbi:Uncharacterised protein [Brevundimonas diminuta]|jgi:hypothetical protein|uniref:Lipoprotein n=3 Tax=Pseudomonadota TaxID=1224 RepID=A0A246K8N1_BREDI|nr:MULTISPECIES: hypothetical protein [Brevundimonas]MBD3832949.1 hypothetical protein [Brevundimonas sp.]MBD3574324.1 hypothetical protein [Brevundimonas diminuta]OWR17666.1 hypothetical protein CD944_13105 [Brevundimonas diminuta]QAT13980.1 hypothetical protein EQG53_06185 [Brevundimonas diminuta]QQB88651.1 hypothetical protein I6H83_16245 [Brevundimonas diminuta]